MGRLGHVEEVQIADKGPEGHERGASRPDVSDDARAKGMAPDLLEGLQGQNGLGLGARLAGLVADGRDEEHEASKLIASLSKPLHRILALHLERKPGRDTRGFDVT